MNGYLLHSYTYIIACILFPLWNSESFTVHFIKRIEYFGQTMKVESFHVQVYPSSIEKQQLIFEYKLNLNPIRLECSLCTLSQVKE